MENSSLFVKINIKVSKDISVLGKVNDASENNTYTHSCIYDMQYLFNILNFFDLLLVPPQSRFQKI